MEQIAAVAVVAAKNFNPSILSQLWLVREKVVGPEDFRPGCLFSDQVSQVETQSFQLIVLPQQLQFAPKCAPEEETSLISEKLGKIVRALPHTPYAAMGLNFIWHEDSGNIAELTRTLFYNGEKALFMEFDTADAKFGSYLSKDWQGLRLKLDIRPVLLDTGAEKRERLQLTFNFHLDLLGENAADKIAQTLGLWVSAREESQRLIGLALK